MDIVSLHGKYWPVTINYFCYTNKNVRLEQLLRSALSLGNELLFQFTFEEVCSIAAAFEEIDNCSLKIIAVVRARIHLSALSAIFRTVFTEIRTETLL